MNASPVAAQASGIDIDDKHFGTFSF